MHAIPESRGAPESGNPVMTGREPVPNRPDRVSQHYGRSDLLRRIREGADRLGKTPESLSLGDLAPVDEFHIGGSLATDAFLEGLGIRAEDHVLDIGCGLGGSSRFAAATYGCRVTGLDLTAEYVETGRTLSSWVGLEDRVDLVHGNALAMGFSPGTFDKAFMLHVGMNIADKRALAAEVWRVLKPGGELGIYDVMRTGPCELTFPVPWAGEGSSSFVASPAEYRVAVEEAGFEVVHERDQSAFAATFFDDLKAAASRHEGPPPLGLHILMGEDAPLKVTNMIENVAEGRVAPFELRAIKGRESD